MRTKFIFFSIMIFLLGKVNSQNVVLMPLDLHEPRVEYHDNPQGIDVAKPRFSLTLTGEGRNRVQSAYQILVSSAKKTLGENNGDAWDSGKVISNSTNQIEYNGGTLQSGKTYYWKVKV